jgi:hypothetical protein
MLPCSQVPQSLPVSPLVAATPSVSSLTETSRFFTVLPLLFWYLGRERGVGVGGWVRRVERRGRVVKGAGVQGCIG